MSWILNWRKKWRENNFARFSRRLALLHFSRHTVTNVSTERLSKPLTYHFKTTSHLDRSLDILRRTAVLAGIFHQQLTNCQNAALCNSISPARFELFVILSPRHSGFRHASHWARDLYSGVWLDRRCATHLYDCLASVLKWYDQAWYC